MAGFDATFTFHPDSLGVVRAINARRPTSCPRHEHANGLNPARHSEPGGRAYVGLRMLLRSTPTIRLVHTRTGTSSSHSIVRILRRISARDFVMRGPWVGMGDTHAKIDLFNQLTTSR
jgi:hypothetical protein